MMKVFLYVFPPKADDKFYFTYSKTRVRIYDGGW